MLKEVSGDILLTKADAIAHGIAPNDNFSSGLALSLRENWPELFLIGRYAKLRLIHRMSRRNIYQSG